MVLEEIYMQGREKGISNVFKLVKSVRIDIHQRQCLKHLDQ